MSIPTSLIVVLLVVAWLVVLVPMVARRRERVPETEDNGAGFRVLRRASASLRRRPGRGTKGSTPMTTASTPMAMHKGDSATDEQNLVTVGAPDTTPTDAAEEWAAAQAGQRPRIVPTSSPSGDPLADPGPDADLSETDAEHGDLHDRRTEELQIVDDAGQQGSADGFGDADDTAPDGPSVPPRASVPDELSEQEWAEHAAAAPTGGAFAEVQDEQLRPIPRRPGRGGFDPEAAEATRAYRYQQRRRITLILFIATVVFTVAAFLLISWLWVGAAVSLLLLVGYLSYLRRQVRIEAAIRQRRMERLQRARQIRPEYARPPRQTRGGLSAVAPGRTAVDLDDDDPAFDDLAEYHQPVTYRRAAGQ